MTVDDLRAMLAAQDHRCAICRNELLRPFIDHDHVTGRIRSLLCCRCNNWLAAVEDMEFLQKATAYLEHHRRTTPAHTFFANTKRLTWLRNYKAAQKARRLAWATTREAMDPHCRTESV